jgi:hypothetical protein
VDEDMQKRLAETEDELRKKEILLLREKSEKEGMVLELSAKRDVLKGELDEARAREAAAQNQAERLAQAVEERDRIKELNAQKIAILESEVKRLRRVQDDLQDERGRLMETLEAHQLRQLQHPQLIQGEASYASIEMLSAAPGRDEKVQALTARCQQLSSLLNVRAEPQIYSCLDRLQISDKKAGSS